METDFLDRNLGLKNHKCKICGKEGIFQSYLVREMMKGTMDEFEYFVCSGCHCLQISEVPNNLGDYYGDGYYSMAAEIDPNVKFEGPVTNSTKILDVGCGIGAWLYYSAIEGHDNLFGCDPFIKEDIHYGKRVNIKKCDITAMEGDGTFDLIRMSDSFEHVINPIEVLENARRLLKDNGYIWISLPIYPNIAFDMFGPYWYQLDAPRHIFIHSINSLRYLADKCDLSIVNVEYNSNPGQVIMSFFYQQGILYNEITNELIGQKFPNSEVEKLYELSEEANKKGIGDHAIIWLSRNK